jgi:hypothetical protein
MKPNGKVALDQAGRDRQLELKAGRCHFGKRRR